MEYPLYIPKLPDTANGLRAAQSIVEMLQEEGRAARKLASQWESLNSSEQSLVHYLEMDADAVKRWSTRGRQVLLIDGELVKEVRLTKSSKIPTEVFRALPYINPLVVFADPPTYKQGSFTMALTGFLIVGFNKIEFSDTDDPDADHLVAVATSAVQKGGKTIDADVTRLSIPMTIGGNTSIEELVSQKIDFFVAARAKSNLGSDPTAPLPEDDKEVRNYLNVTLRSVIGSIMYLVSTTLDTEKIASSHVRKSVPTARKPFSAYRVGWNIGNALSRRRREWQASLEPSQQGHEQDPQHRRAHTKIVWTGPGSRVPRLAFVGPYWTHLEKMGKTGVNTIRRVR